MASRLFLTIAVCITLVLASRGARAEMWEAPIGGKALSVGEGRVACPGTSGAWAIEQEGRAVRPPTTDDAVGKSVDLKVAPSASACTTAVASVTLVAVGHSPVVDPNASILFVDEARVEVHGRGLRGMVVRWQNGDRGKATIAACSSSAGARGREVHHRRRSRPARRRDGARHPVDADGRPLGRGRGLVRYGWPSGWA